MIPDIHYIYIIKNIVTKNFYIGHSIEPKHRFKTHMSGLKRKFHYSKLMIKDYHLHKIKSFDVSILTTCDTRKEATFLEHFFILKLNPKYNGVTFLGKRVKSEYNEWSIKNDIENKLEKCLEGL